MTKREESYHTAASCIDEAESSQMFGKPCYKINKKAFCSFFKEEMVFKLNGYIHQEALSLDGSSLFDPSGKGRPMKEWVVVSFDYAADWSKYAASAAEYVKASNSV